MLEELSEAYVYYLTHYQLQLVFRLYTARKTDDWYLDYIQLEKLMTN